jgi:hypothetical protein
MVCSHGGQRRFLEPGEKERASNAGHGWKVYIQMVGANKTKRQSGTTEIQYKGKTETCSAKTADYAIGQPRGTLT